MDESTPVMRAQQQMETLRGQREQAVAEVKKLLERFGGGPPEPSNLEQIARSIRRHVDVRKQMSELDKSWGWIDEEKRVAEASAKGLKERATRLIEQAGLKHEPEKPWSAYVQQLGEMTGGVRRHETLKTELIPAAEKRMMPDTEEKALRAEIERLTAEGPATPVGIPRAAGEIDTESRETREKLDTLQKQREELRLDVDRVSRTYHQKHPELSSEMDRVVAALERARRFQQSVEVAKETIAAVAVETHRRWADWMNSRVSELLRTVGTKLDGLRFGEDLDFSVKFDNGQQATRGRALSQLSAGARDQLHLAVRLAVSEYLSRGNSALPLLVDDAFATSDDTRARAGMKLLIEHFSKQHQVIVVTCHRQRHESFAEKDKALWADRVQVLDVGAKA
jgi:chromosome segregation protein